MTKTAGAKALISGGLTVASGLWHSQNLLRGHELVPGIGDRHIVVGTTVAPEPLRYLSRKNAGQSARI